MKVRELMSTPPVTIGPATHLKDVAEIFRSRQISSVPVVDGGRHLLGVISEADLLALETITDQRRQALPEDVPSEAPVTAGDAMTREVISVEADSDAAEAARVMTVRRLRHVPVLEEGKVAGMLSRRDLIGMMSRSDGEIEADVRDLLTTELGRLAPEVKVEDGHLYIGLSREAPVYRLAQVLATSVPGILAVSPLACRA